MYKTEYNIIYSLGIRCTTELALKKINFKKMSSIFGSINIRNFDNIIKCIDSNFDILFNKDNIISTHDIKCMEKCPYSRTLNKMFDDITDWDSATFAHHDIINNNNHLQHFIRGIERFNKIKDNHISTLFINISIANEFNNTTNTDDLVDILIKTGWTNFHILFIYFNGLSDKQINKDICDNNKTIIVINDDIGAGIDDEQKVADYLKIILDDYNLKKLLSIEDIDSLFKNNCF